MRYTLLPESEKIILRREYHIRVAIVFSFVLSLAILVGIASLFPAFFRASVEENAAMSETTLVSDASLAKIQTDMTKSLGLLDLLVTDENSPNFSDLINDVVNLRNDLKLSSISANKESSTTLSVSLQGLAPTRDSLILFKKRFEAAKPGNKVDLPVSELTKDANISFSIKITEKLP